MTHHRTSTVALALCLVSLGTLACDDEATPAPKAEGPTTAASTAATTTAPKKKAAPTPKKAADTQTLNGTVKVGSEDVAVAIDVPKGIKVVDDMGPGSLSIRRGKDDFDGYGFMVMGGGRGVDATKIMAALKAQAAKNPEKKMVILDEGTSDDGWHVAASFEEGGKRAVTLKSEVTIGEHRVSCAGDATGDVIADEKAAAEVLLAGCKSLRKAE